jgi:hypothetical protein
MVDSGVASSGFAGAPPSSTRPKHQSSPPQRRAIKPERGAQRSGEQVVRDVAARFVWHHFQ